MSTTPAARLPDVYAPALSISVDGRPLEAAIAQRILRVSVTEHLSVPDDFSFDLYDPTLELVDADGGRLTEGAIVELSLGYVGRTRKLITGRISSIAADFPSGGPPTVTVQGFDLLLDLARGTAYRPFKGSTPGSGAPDSQIATLIAQEAGLQAVVDQTSERRTPRVQNHESNLDFLQAIAAENGFSLWVQDRTLHFQRQRRPRNPATIRLAWGRTLQSFTPRVSTTGQVESVEVRGWDPKEKRQFTERAQRRRPGGPGRLSTGGERELRQGADGGSRTVVDDASVSSPKEAQALAESILADQLRAALSGSGTSYGEPDMGAGTPLELSNLGRFSGTYTATEVTHTLGGAGYQTTFQVDGAAAATARFASGQEPSERRMHGVVPAIVTGNKDEERRGRVQVRVPALADKAEHWARLATLMAGPERGTFFLPEEGDEVLVAFERGRPESLFVVGALWNGRDAQPDANANGKNDLRFIKSRSGHLIRLDDSDGKEKVEIIDAEGKNRVTLDTATGNLTVESGNDLVLKAPDGTIRLEAKRIETSSTGDTAVAAKGKLGLRGSTVDIN
ncbi:MAG TPA: phage baseplate assembly protein V [Actinomycetes bacterium]